MLWQGLAVDRGLIRGLAGLLAQGTIGELFYDAELQEANSTAGITGV